MIRRFMVIAVIAALYSMLFASVVLAGDFGAVADLDGVDETVRELTQLNTHDGGMDMVLKAQDNPLKDNVAESANTQLQKYARKMGFKINWDEKNQRMCRIYEVPFNISNPATDPDFQQLRATYLSQAVLRAKADMVSFIMSEMSASNQLDTPGTEPYRQMNAEYEALRKLIVERQALLATLLERVDKAEADRLKGVTVGDMIYSAMEAAINKLDRAFDIGKIEKSLLAKYENAKREYESMASELAELSKKAEELKQSTVQTYTSTFSAAAENTMVGSVVIQHAESWHAEDDMYRVAVLLAWSKSLEKTARSIMAAGDLPEEVSGEDGTVADWLATQDMGKFIGSRQFLDEDGNRFFIGAAARPFMKNAFYYQRNKDMAEDEARALVLTSLFSDVVAKSTWERLTQVKNIDEEFSKSETMESITKQMREDFPTQKLPGIVNLYNGDHVHPISREKIYVTVYGISRLTANQALRMGRSNNQTLRQIFDEQRRMQESLKQEQELTEMFRRGTAVYVRPKPSDTLTQSVGARANEDAGSSRQRNNAAAPAVRQTGSPSSAPRSPMRETPSPRPESDSFMPGPVQANF